MPLQAPNIDNRSFSDILAEARTRIPRYTPEWTDLNDNDPGIALVQLFAWMTDMLIFRMNQVPELNYIKFLQLLGIELRPAEPARTELTFPLTKTQPEQTVVVPKGTQVASAGATGDEPVIFETDESLIALATRTRRSRLPRSVRWRPKTARYCLALAIRTVSRVRRTFRRRSLTSPFTSRTKACAPRAQRAVCLIQISFPPPGSSGNTGTGRNGCR
jgi:predicted phage baseplate assembly protein